jgi:hypothetical protein
LPADTARRFALLQKTSLIDHQNSVGIGKRFERIVSHNIAQIISIPPASPENSLLTPRPGITRRLRSHPARLPALLAQQTIKKKPRRRGNPFLREQGTHPRLHIPQRRRPKLQRRLDRCSRHP